MPSAAAPNPRAGSAPVDDLDHLLDYDNAVDEFMRDIPAPDTANTTAIQQPRADDDEEVQVKRKRKPVPKLDEDRLLSDAGITKLRKITRTRAKFRGKGHEFSDISRLLNTYQLWLDDLYPRAKFRDALAMVEKVGHSKRMQVMRRAWLDETKPHRRDDTPGQAMSGGLGPYELLGQDALEERNGSPTPAETSGSKPEDQGAPEEDELDALLAERGVDATMQARLPPPKQKTPLIGDNDNDEPDEDELGAILSGNVRLGSTREHAKTARRGPFQEDSHDEDNLDALMAEQNGTSPRPSQKASQAPAFNIDHTDSFADDEEAMASMNW